MAQQGRLAPVLVTCGLAILLGVGSYLWANHADLPYAASPPEKVVIANFVYTGSCPILAASAHGDFTREGVSVTIESYGSGKATLDALRSGRADLAIAGDLPLMFAIMDRQSISVVASIVRAQNVLGIVGRKDKGISTPADLKGKTIGVTIGTAGHYALDAYLARQKLTEHDITIRDIAADDMFRPLVSGEIDGASNWQPYLNTLQMQLGRNGVTFQTGDLYTATLNVVGTESYVASHTEALKRITRALVLGAQYCKDNPADARDLVAKLLQVDANSLGNTWSEYQFKVSLDQRLLLALRDESHWAISNKLVERNDVPDFMSHMSPEALQAVAAANVTLAH